MRNPVGDRPLLGAVHFAMLFLESNFATRMRIFPPSSKHTKGARMNGQSISEVQMGTDRPNGLDCLGWIELKKEIPSYGQKFKMAIEKNCP